MTKLIKIFSFLFLIVMVSACNNDDESSTNAEDLVGTWRAISFEATNSVAITGTGADVTTSTDITGSNLDYEVTFTESNFSTSGAYDIEATVEVVGVSTTTSNDSYTNVSGNGTYTVDGNMMTIDGSFFELEVDGVDLSAFGEEQTVNWEINSDGNLVITQDETDEVTISGVGTTSTVTSTSVWEKQ